MQTTESELIEAMSHDSQKAFAELYRMYASQLVAFAMRYTKKRQTVEELVEDTFLWVWNNRKNIHATDSLRPILFIRMRTYLINAYRQTVRSPKFESYLDYLSLAAVDDTDARMDYDDFLLRFQKALAQLPPTQQKVVSMAKLDRISVKDIAERLGLNEQTVRNQISLGLKRLRNELGISAGIIEVLLMVNF